MAQPRDTRQIRSDLAARAADMPRGPDGQFLPIHGAYSGRLDDDTMLDHRRADVQDYLAYRAKLVRDLTGSRAEFERPPRGPLIAVAIDVRVEWTGG